ncbi:flagellar basal body P-ring formation protein FlgA [Pikeienuella piscinae]|uniref:Flagella basal body P-ring formation protein FlgA n=1 Tax=Pikeienuella piscinae TaxID=2748098 RepID=A0A7L5C0Q9_9RHOB|nr:flagellar basal body P-ring formation chaperone FlgA [Pikeienuella piscinae]QIE56973.1 flagellar basal body P-ring formation protein FlgA [Pikeienuella piscinae]
MIGRLGAAVALALVLGAPAAAESLVAARAILARTVVGADDIRLAEAVIPGAISDPAAAVGREARVTIYEGRPVRPGDLVAPALVERNQVVRISFESGALDIKTDGRALERGALGERVRVMNLSSRLIISGAVSGPGAVAVAR